MVNFKRGDRVKVEFEAEYERGSVTPGLVVVSLPDGNISSVPANSVRIVHPVFEPGLVIRISSGYLAEFVAMRTRMNWHFDSDEEAVWSDEEILAAMEKHGYEVIYNPNKEGNDD